jgi:hypothetical protein
MPRLCLLALVLACTRSNPAFVIAADAETAPPPFDGARTPADAAPPPVPPDASVVLPDAATPEAAGAPAGAPRYPFESSAQGWQDLRDTYYHQPTTPVVRSTARAFEGQASLEISIDTMNGYTTPTIGVRISEALAAGTRITYHLWFPAGGAIEAVQPYVFYDKRGFKTPQWGGIDPVLFTSTLTPGAWNTVTHVVPDDIVGDVVEVGLEWRTSGNQRVKVYLDAVTW